MSVERIGQFASARVAFPGVTQTEDLFSAARFIPTPPGGLYPAQAQRHVAEHAGDDGFRFVTPTRADGFALCAHIGGTRDWSPDWLKRGEHIRRRMGATFYGTYSKPTARVLDWWREHISDPDREDPAWRLNLSGFECVRWDSGQVLVIGRSESAITARWLAVLEPDATPLLDMMPLQDRALIASEQAADHDAWGE